MKTEPSRGCRITPVLLAISYERIHLLAVDVEVKPKITGIAHLTGSSVDSSSVNSSSVNSKDQFLFEQDLGHHSLVLVVQQMTMKYRHSLDDWLRQIQDHINGAANGNIYGIQPDLISEWDVIFGVGKEVDLVNVERM